MLVREGKGRRRLARLTWPNYSLLYYLNSVTPATVLARDCATGNGQSAVAQASDFNYVIATDGCAAQIDAAKKCPILTIEWL
mgnify:FL=1|jgi:hypothetical protein